MVIRYVAGASESASVLHPWLRVSPVRCISRNIAALPAPPPVAPHPSANNQLAHFGCWHSHGQPLLADVRDYMRARVLELTYPEAQPCWPPPKPTTDCVQSEAAFPLAPSQTDCPRARRTVAVTPHPRARRPASRPRRLPFGRPDGLRLICHCIRGLYIYSTEVPVFCRDGNCQSLP